MADATHAAGIRPDVPPTGAVPLRGTPSPAVGEALDPLFAEFLRRARPQPDGRPPTLRQWVDLAEAWRITRALRDCRGNRSAAARCLGIGRRTLYSKLERLGLAEP